MATSARWTFKTNSVAIGALVVKIPASFERRVMNALAEVADESIKDAIAEHTKTGRLAESYYNRQVPSKRGRELGHDLQIAPHAKYVIEGTRPHEIKAKNAPALVFFWPKVNAVVAFQKVNHPGYEGDDYILKAQVESMNAFPQIVESLGIDEP